GTADTLAATPLLFTELCAQIFHRRNAVFGSTSGTRKKQVLAWAMFDIVAGIMHFRFLALTAVGLLALVQNTAAQTEFKYPAAPTSNQVDDYNGVKVADPYRPLENPDSPESRAWIEAENKITFDFLKTIPEREGIKKRLTEIWNYERFGVPFKEHGRYFLSKNAGLQNQNVIYTTTNFSETPRELLDPNLLAKDGTIALGGLDVTDDARLMAYGLATAG